MLFRERTGFYWENYFEHKNTLFGQRAEFPRNHCTLNIPYVTYVANAYTEIYKIY
jgi:hypothetical protein